MQRKPPWILVLLLCYGPASAFNPQGHEIIEAAAYKQVLARDSIAYDSGAYVSGGELIRYLIGRNVLKQPGCFVPAGHLGPLPDTLGCGADRLSMPARWWPVPGSGRPDYLLSRQFGSAGQCFHFMSKVSDARRMGRDSAGRATPAMRDSAYARCVRNMNTILAAILAGDTTVIHSALKTDSATMVVSGSYAFYSLVHMIADSYSEAHVQRRGMDSIEYLKPWELRSLMPRSLDPSWDSLYRSGGIHRPFGDDRDADFLAAETSPACPACRRGDCPLPPYAVAWECLSERGQSAALAVSDFMIALYAAMRHKDSLSLESSAGWLGHSAGLRPGTRVYADWEGYLGRHFAHVGGLPPMGTLRPDEIDPSHALNFGLHYSQARAGAYEIGILYEGNVIDQALLPFGAGNYASFVYREDGHRAWIGGEAVRINLSLPVSDHVTLAITPLSSRFFFTFAEGVPFWNRFDVGESLLFPASFYYRNFWMRVEATRYRWNEKSWDPDYLALTLGGSLDVPLRYMERKSLPTMPYAFPVLRNGNFASSRISSCGGFLVTLLSEGDVFSFGVEGQSAFGDRTWDNRLRAWSLGPWGAANLVTAHGDHVLALSASPAFSFRIFTDNIILRLLPLIATGGFFIGGDDSHFLGALSARPALTFSLRKVAVSLFGPSFNYAGNDRAGNQYASLSFGGWLAK